MFPNQPIDFLASTFQEWSSAPTPYHHVYQKKTSRESVLKAKFPEISVQVLFQWNDLKSLSPTNENLRHERA